MGGWGKEGIKIKDWDSGNVIKRVLFVYILLFSRLTVIIQAPTYRVLIQLQKTSF